MLLDGAHLVSEALHGGFRVTHLFVSLDESMSASIAPLLATADDRGVDVIEATAPVMAAISPVRSASALVALADRPDTSSRVFTATPPLVVIACDVQDPGNLGAMIRVAEGSGATGFVAAGDCADVYGWKAMRGSMGSALRLPIAVERDVTRAVDTARGHGCRVVATVPRGGVEFFTADLRQPTALLLGGEGRGLGPDVVDAADERVTIPMTPPVESLNVAVATALITYEARRQRG